MHRLQNGRAFSQVLGGLPVDRHGRHQVLHIAGRSVRGVDKALQDLPLGVQNTLLTFLVVKQEPDAEQMKCVQSECGCGCGKRSVLAEPRHTGDGHRNDSYRREVVSAVLSIGFLADSGHRGASIR